MPIQETVNVPRYHLSQRLVHWLMALLVLLAIAIGMPLGLLGFEGAEATFGSGPTDLLYISHKTIGVLLLGFITLRVMLRLVFGKPPYPVPLPALQRRLSRLVHALLYALLIVMPLLGWSATASGGFPINFFHWELPPILSRNPDLSEQLFFWHAVTAWSILGLVALHVAGAVYHWRIRHDGVMRRMSLLP